MKEVRYRNFLFLAFFMLLYFNLFGNAAYTTDKSPIVSKQDTVDSIKKDTKEIMGKAQRDKKTAKSKDAEFQRKRIPTQSRKKKIKSSLDSEKTILKKSQTVVPKQSSARGTEAQRHKGTEDSAECKVQSAKCKNSKLHQAPPTKIDTETQRDKKTTKVKEKDKVKIENGTANWSASAPTDTDVAKNAAEPLGSAVANVELPLGAAINNVEDILVLEAEKKKFAAADTEVLKKEDSKENESVKAVEEQMQTKKTTEDSSTSSTSLNNSTSAVTPSSNGANNLKEDDKNPPPASAQGWSEDKIPEEKHQEQKQAKEEPFGFAIMGSLLKDKFNLQNFSGSVTYNNQIIDTGTKIVDEPFSFVYNFGYQKPIGAKKNFNFNFSNNEQYTSAQKNKTSQSASTFTMKAKKFNLTYNKNYNETLNVPAGSESKTTITDSNQINTILNVSKKIPMTLNLGKNVSKSVSGSGSSPTQNTTTTTSSLSMSQNIFGKLKSTLTYNNSVSKVLNQGSKTDNSIYGINLTYPLSKIIDLTTSIQNTITKSIPADPAQKTISDTMKYDFVSMIKLTKTINLTANHTIDSNKSTTPTGSVNKQMQNSILGLQYTQKMITANLKYTLNSTENGPSYDDTNLTLGLNPEIKVIKGANVTITNRITKDKDDKIQSDNNTVTLNKTMPLMKKLTLSSNYTYTNNENFPQNQATSTTQISRVSMLKLDNPLTKSVSQSLTLQRNESEASAGASSKTDTETYTISRNSKIKIGKKELGTNLGYKYTLTSVAPTGNENINDGINLNLSYKLSGDLNANHIIAFTKNKAKTNTAATNINSTMQNQYTLNYKSKKNATASLNMNLANTLGATNSRTKNIIFNVNIPLKYKTSYSLSFNWNRDQQGKEQMNMITGVVNTF